MKTTAIREAVRRLRGMNLYTLAAQVDAEADTAVEVTQALAELVSFAEKEPAFAVPSAADCHAAFVNAKDALQKAGAK